MGDCVGVFMGLWAKEWGGGGGKGSLSRGRGRGGLSGAISLQALLPGRGKPAERKPRQPQGIF